MLKIIIIAFVIISWPAFPLKTIIADCHLLGFDCICDNSTTQPTGNSENNEISR